MVLGTIVPVCEKIEKSERRMLSFKSAVSLTNSLIKKFCYMKIVEVNHLLPPKKRKITENLISEETDVEMVDLSANNSGEEKIQDSVKSQSLRIIVPPKRNRIKRLNSNRKFPRTRNKQTNIESTALDIHPAISLYKLFCLFENCVNFIRPRGLKSAEDIDQIVRSFNLFGKVLSIQDHWVQPQGSLNPHISAWMGALVTYRNQDDLQAAVKAFSVRETQVIGVCMVDHLARISFVESNWRSQFKNGSTQGTSIIIEGIAARGSSKIREELEIYGTILSIIWLNKTYSKYVCRVTYNSTVSAVAAALALDGKNFMRGILRTKIQMTAKEILIHRKLCELF